MQWHKCIKGIVPPNFLFCVHLLTLVSFPTFMTLFLMWNRKKCLFVHILSNVVWNPFTSIGQKHVPLKKITLRTTSGRVNDRIFILGWTVSIKYACGVQMLFEATLYRTEIPTRGRLCSCKSVKAFDPFSDQCFIIESCTLNGNLNWQATINPDYPNWAFK